MLETDVRVEVMAEVMIDRDEGLRTTDSPKRFQCRTCAPS